MKRNCLFTVLLLLLLAAVPCFASDIRWSADTTMLIVLNDHEIQAVSAAANSPQLTFTAPSDEMYFIDYFPESGKVFWSDGIRSVFGAFDSSTLSEKLRIEPEEPILSIDVSEDGSRILACSGDELSVILYDGETGSEIKRLSGYSTAAPVYDAMFSPDGNSVLWHSRGTFVLQNIEDESFGEYIQLWDFAYSYALSPDGKTLAVGLPDETSYQPLVLFFDTRTGEELGRVEVGQQVSDFDFSETGKLVFAVDPGVLYEIDAEYYEVLTQKTLFPGADLSSEPRLQRVASGYGDLVFAIRLNTGGILTTTLQ